MEIGSSLARWLWGIVECKIQGEMKVSKFFIFIQTESKHQIGKQQLHDLGKYLRKRYAKLLRGGRYSANKVYDGSQSTVVQITSGKVQ